MIGRVCEAVSEKRVKKVKKDVAEWITETVYETVTRSKKVYERPTTVDHCLHCGEYLKGSMWVYGKSGKFLCPTCWYRRTTQSQKDEYKEKS